MHVLAAHLVPSNLHLLLLVSVTPSHHAVFWVSSVKSEGRVYNAQVVLAIHLF